MRALSLCVLVLLVAALAAAVEPARACSCAQPDPRSALATADGAFVGTMVSRRETSDFQAILTFDVERALKGSFGERVEIVTARDSAGCGLEMPVGTRTGLVLDRRDGAWHGHLCAQFSPADLLAAARPLPAPNGRGPVALFVGGGFGAARMMALDGKGRTLAYGKGSGTTTLVSPCPRGKRLAEVAYDASDGSSQLAIRDTRTLRVIRRQTLTFSRPGQLYLAAELLCEDRLGSSVLLFVGPGGDAPNDHFVYRFSTRGRTTIWHGMAHYAHLNRRHAYLSAGSNGATLLAVDVRSKATTRLGRLPGATSGLRPDGAGTRLVGIHHRLDRTSLLVVINIAKRPATVRTEELSVDTNGDVFWLPGGRILVVPSYYDQDNVARVLGAQLRTLTRFRWAAGSAALRGSTVFGLGSNGTLVAADLPSGPMRTIRRLPSPTAYAIVAV